MKERVPDFYDADKVAEMPYEKENKCPCGNLLGDNLDWCDECTQAVSDAIRLIEHERNLGHADAKQLLFDEL
jgi:hypothetical protein